MIVYRSAFDLPLELLISKGFSLTEIMTYATENAKLVPIVVDDEPEPRFSHDRDTLIDLDTAWIEEERVTLPCGRQSGSRGE